jgi:hypothetical protein
LLTTRKYPSENTPELSKPIVPPSLLTAALTTWMFSVHPLIAAWMLIICAAAGDGSTATALPPA